MNKQLNQVMMEERCAALGMSQTSIAEQLGLSRAAVSKWFKGKSFPRPLELLKLGKLLGLRHSELVQTTDAVAEPLVAFRKRAGCKTTDNHLTRAKNMGQLLRPLVNYLGFDPFLGPPSLKNPTTDYRYLQNLVARIRREMDISEGAPLGFDLLISFFKHYQAVVIPVLWGKKSKHENALHIHLPESKTTWIYLNLDVELHDFKFWMAHELGHVMTSDLLEAGSLDKAENFADKFAGALLYPESAAEIGFKAYKRQRTEKGRLQEIITSAKEFTISPLSIYLELKNYAEAHGESFMEIDASRLHTEIANFNKSFPTVADDLFDGHQPTANHFMRIAHERFDTVFFKAFAQYVREHDPNPSTIAGILSVNPIDARAYQDALIQ